ncbi:MAG: ketol-acid reductoisomerase [Candidatus Krumholzibacteria bacterium]|nr:ketol-acid reductoisomerase [Candidatus Krumholzibacteria bacterium]
MLRDAKTAVLGYGNQGHAHAMNLRDSGVDVVVGARERGGGWSRALDDGFQTLPIGEAVERAEYVVVLLPDEVQGKVFREEIQPHLKKQAALVFAHGFAVAFGAVAPPAGHDVLLVAPKGQGHYLRKLYGENKGLPCLIAIENDASGAALDKGISYAHALGCLRVGAIETTFREEAITDLFGEQTVLCGGVPKLVKAAFETLVERGYRPEIAYLECLHELKIITDLMHSGGVAAMRERISRTAAWGSYLSEGRIVSKDLRAEMSSILDEIESGEFATGWQREAAEGQTHLSKLIHDEAAHPIERAGAQVRDLMPYLKEEEW